MQDHLPATTLAGAIHDEIVALLTDRWDYFVADLRDSSGRFVQGTLVGDDAGDEIHIEVCADRFVRRHGLGSEGERHLSMRGWSLASEACVNHWRRWPRRASRAAAGELAMVLRDLFDVTRQEDLAFSHEDDSDIPTAAEA